LYHKVFKIHCNIIYPATPSIISLSSLILAQKMTTVFPVSKKNMSSSVLSEMDRQEMEGLTAFAHMSKPSIPLRINYDDIFVSGFYSDLKFDPREKFNRILNFAEKRIDRIIGEYAAKDSCKPVGHDSWEIQAGFITIKICLHCVTKYDCGTDVFEDTAIHRVVVSMSAFYNTKQVYVSTAHTNKVFEGMNTFHENLIAGLK